VGKEEESMLEVATLKTSMDLASVKLMQIFFVVFASLLLIPLQIGYIN